MEMALSFLTLAVEELASAARFYEQGLGLVRRPSQSGLLLYPLGGLTLALLRRADLAVEIGLGSPGPLPAGAHPGLLLSLNLPSDEAVRAAFTRAVAAGARPLSSPQLRPWGGFRGTFLDPQGFPWELCHNPKWTGSASPA
jgi:uncharacterized protein